MSAILVYLKRLPWWFWVAVFIAALLTWQSLSGWALSSKYFKMLINEIRQDQSQIIKERETQITKFEADIKKLEKEKLMLLKSMQEEAFLFHSRLNYYW